MTKHEPAGRLLVVATPIGNLGDLSDRAREALRSADRILCEDTRRTRRLLAAIGSGAKLESFHEHNEDEKIDDVVGWIDGGETIVLVSDAGTPVLSDPGFTLLRRARETGIRVEPLPGPFAGALALVASGLATQPFTFWGFAPRKKGERTRFYERIRASGMTAVVYEAPHRLVASLEDARTILGEIDMTVAREMTKLHEEFLNGTISAILERLRERESILGEITLVFAATEPALPGPPDPAALRREFERMQEDGMSRSDAIHELSDRHGMRRNELYRMLL